MPGAERDALANALRFGATAVEHEGTLLGVPDPQPSGLHPSRSVTDAAAALTVAEQLFVHGDKDFHVLVRRTTSAYASATRASGTSAVTMSSTRTSPSTRSRIDSA